MRTLFPLIAIAATGLALSACGGEPEYPPGGKGPHGSIAMPPASPSIHFKVGDANGNTLDIAIECGAKSDIKECAKVNESIIDRVAQIRERNSNAR